MKREEAQAEAEKIRDKFRPHALLWDDHNDEPTKEDHVTLCAIIHVKGVIHELKISFIDLPLMEGLKLSDKIGTKISDFESILTELERTE